MSRESLPEAVQAATSAAWRRWQSDASVGEGRDSQDHLLCELPLHLVGDACIPAFLERALDPVAQVLVVRRCRTERRRVAHVGVLFVEALKGDHGRMLVTHAVLHLRVRKGVLFRRTSAGTPSQVPRASVDAFHLWIHFSDSLKPKPRETVSTSDRPLPTANRPAVLSMRDGKLRCYSRAQQTSWSGTRHKLGCVWPRLGR